MLFGVIVSALGLDTLAIVGRSPASEIRGELVLLNPASTMAPDAVLIHQR